VSFGGSPDGGSGGSSSGTSGAGSVHEALHLHETSLAFPTGGTLVQKVAGTASGRIFLAGAQRGGIESSDGTLVGMWLSREGGRGAAAGERHVTETV
jgi:hypothetical protein